MIAEIAVLLAMAVPAVAVPAVAYGEDAASPRILCVGTSLTAGFGLDPDLAWPAVLQQKIDAAGLRYRVVNAGVSGETSAGALRRIDWLLREPAAILVVETGANDGLRGQEPETTRANLQGILERARRQSPAPKLVLAGMMAPPNLGADYTRRFRAVFPEVAKANGAALVPFLLEGVADIPRLNQADGIHPTAEGQQIVAENVWRVLRPLLAPASAPAGHSR
jgi:acyl-CoA thioesterase I